MPPEARIATFDQDGTLWVEHPMYSQVITVWSGCRRWSKAKPELGTSNPSRPCCPATARRWRSFDGRPREDPRRHAHRHERGRVQLKRGSGSNGRGSTLEAAVHRAHLPADAGGAEVLRANGYKTYIVTGGGQDFVRVYAEQSYGIPPEQVVGTAGGTKYGYAKNGKPFLTKEPKLILNDNNAGKPEGIHLMIGRRPYAAFGNSTGDRQMLEYANAGDGARLRCWCCATMRRASMRTVRPGATWHQGRHLHAGAV